MRIFQFITEHCQDLVEAAKLQKSMIDLGEFPHDEIIEDSDGKKVPVVYVDGNSIPVMDFFTMTKSDFLNAWKTPSAAEAFDNYLSSVTILEGEEVVDRVRNAILAETEALNHEVQLYTDF